MDYVKPDKRMQSCGILHALWTRGQVETENWNRKAENRKYPSGSICVTGTSRSESHTCDADFNCVCARCLSQIYSGVPLSWTPLGPSASGRIIEVSSSRGLFMEHALLKKVCVPGWHTYSVSTRLLKFNAPRCVNVHTLLHMFQSTWTCYIA